LALEDRMDARSAAVPISSGPKDSRVHPELDSEEAAVEPDEDVRALAVGEPDKVVRALAVGAQDEDVRGSAEF